MHYLNYSGLQRLWGKIKAYVGDGTVKITQGGVEKGSFSMNQTGATTIELSGISVATEDTVGGIKLGFTKTDKKYPVELDENNKAYVEVDINYLDMVSYGVSWIAGQSDPTLNRIGNMAYHKSLPIQSKMRGCIAQPTQTNPIQYYLNADDWRWREDPITVSNVSLVATTTTTDTTSDEDEASTAAADSGDTTTTEETTTTTTTTYTITNTDYFGTLQYEKMWIKLGTVECQVYSIDTTTSTATILPKSALETGTYVMELGSCRNGYDGFVMVDVPKFYIKSWDGATGEEQSVRISTINVEGDWEEQPRMLVNAYKAGILRSVPENMGYLSTLSANAAICCVNEHDYCRGGNNNSNCDQYIESDPCRSLLNKYCSYKQRSVFRTYVRLSCQEIMNYSQWKNLAWLFFVEYATFYSQDEFNGELTSEGYHQGGLGNGVTNVSNSGDFGWIGVVPNGYADNLGNNTGVKLLESACLKPANGVYMSSYRGIQEPFGDSTFYFEGNLYQSKILYINNNPNNYIDEADEFKANADRTIYVESMWGFVSELNLGSHADIIGRNTKGSATTCITDMQTPLKTDEVGMLVQGASSGDNAGFCYFAITKLSTFPFGVGYRAVCELDYNGHPLHTTTTA